MLPLELCCAALAAMAPHPVGAADLARDQRQAIESIIHDYLLQHPDVLFETLRRGDANLKRDAAETAKQALAARGREIFDDPETPVGGNPKGDATLVEFFDYRCPYCKQVQPILLQLLAVDRQLHVGYKEFPVLGPVSVVAAHAALAARVQGKYEAFHNAMMAATGAIAEDTIWRVARSVGLDLDRLKHDMASPRIDAVLKATLDLANDLDIRGTPTFVAGDRIVPGATDLPGLEGLVAGARKQ
jgi:protein-disulfide isomerase